MKFFIWKKTLYPVIALVAALFIAVFCLITARELNCSYFIIGAFLWAALFGCYRGCMRIFAPFIVDGQQAWRIVYLCGDRYEHIDRAHDTQSFAGTYPPCNHFGYAHLYVLCAHAQRGDKAGTRGNENARGRQRVKPKNLISRLFGTICYAAGEYLGYARAVGGNARLYAGRQPVLYL